MKICLTPLTAINRSVQIVIMPEIRRSMNNKDLFIHNAMEEVTGLLLMTVQHSVSGAQLSASSGRGQNFGK